MESAAGSRPGKAACRWLVLSCRGYPRVAADQRLHLVSGRRPGADARALSGTTNGRPKRRREGPTARGEGRDGDGHYRCQGHRRPAEDEADRGKALSFRSAAVDLAASHVAQDDGRDRGEPGGENTGYAARQSRDGQRVRPRLGASNRCWRDVARGLSRQVRCERLEFGVGLGGQGLPDPPRPGRSLSSTARGTSSTATARRPGRASSTIPRWPNYCPAAPSWSTTTSTTA